ncbi:MAG: DUF3089 domain-containing protein [Flavobacteriaceae bacterium]|nr:DUF3089 domain-containing protein [Flavobacteriaceae bacterium]
MKFLHFKVFAPLLIFFLSTACKPVYQSMLFDPKSLPEKPNYAASKSWAAFPGKYPLVLQTFEKSKKDKKADVFFVYPTLLTDKKIKDWNADIWSSSIRQDVFQTALKYQASAWLNAGDLYVPFYRQAHYRVFVDPYSKMAEPAWEIAYEDVKNAFQYYLENYNMGKPIIIASHSQGSMHAKRLIKEFFDEKPLQNQLVAAYLIGTRIYREDFESIHPLENPNDVGGFVSWNAYKMDKRPDNYDRWYKGGVTTNPISWNTQTTSKISDHKGVMSEDLVIYPKSLSVQVIDGLLWTSLPQIPGRFFLSLIENYHFADINLFWKDIEHNAINRVEAWYQKKSNEKK